VRVNPYVYGSLLFDLKNDPHQEHPMADAHIEKRMIELMVDLMKHNDAPAEQYVRLGIPQDGNVTDEHLNLQETRSGVQDRIGNTDVIWQGKGKAMYYGLLNLVPMAMRRQFVVELERAIKAHGIHKITQDTLEGLVRTLIPQEQWFITQIVRAKGK
jgi:hypothetical protein